MTELRSPPPTIDFLAGGGESGALIRAKDWSATPLGPIDSWPQSLRTAASICINSNFPIAVAWGPHHIQIYNDGYKPICGGKHPRSMGQDFTECWAEAWPVIGESFRIALEGGSSFLEDQRIFLYRHGYLEETFFTFSFSPIRDEAGNIVGLFHPVTETTARMLSERRTRALRDLARAAKAHTVVEAFALVAETLGEYDLDIPFLLFYQIDEPAKQARLVATAGIARATAASPELVDLEAEVSSGWPFAEVVRTGGPVQVDALADRFGELTCGPYAESPQVAFSMPIFAPGTRHPLGVLVAGVSACLPMNDAYRAFYDLLAVAVTTIVGNALAYEQERSRAEALAQLDRAKIAFFSNVSHEFRTPLTLMLGPLEDGLADEVEPLSATQRDRQALAHRSALRLLKLVNTLLDFSRIEAGRIDASYEPTDLAGLTADVASMFRSAVEKAGVSLVVETASLPELVYVDRDMWEKIVLNLLSNAFKHTFEGEIAVTLRAGEGHATLEVRDTGVGIPPDQLSRVFERFHRVPNTRSRTHEGTGIGLSLVQELVRLHGGQTEVASVEGSGTVFTVRVPLGAAHLPRERIGAPREGASTSLGARPFVEEALRWIPDDDKGSARNENDVVHRPESFRTLPAASAGDNLPRRCRIVVADDNSDMREYVTRLLRDRGWDVEAVSDGKAALEIVRRNPPDLVLADVMMPGLDGMELLRALRADARTRGVAVVLLSARAGEEARSEGMEAGADDYLVKPFAARELVARIENHLGRARTEAERSRLAELFLQAPAAIAVLRGPTHVYELANEEYLRFIGNRGVLGKPAREALPEVEGQGVFELLDEVYRSGKPFVGDAISAAMDHQGTGVLKEQFFNCVLQPLRDANGAVSGIFIHAVDVTDQLRSRLQLQIANERLRVATDRAEAIQAEAEEANQAKSDFLATMSHELRTPLNAVTGHVELLEMEVYGPVTPAQHGALLRIKKSGDHLLSLINDVLNFAKLKAGRVQFAIEDVSVSGILADVASMIEPQLQARRLTFEMDIDPALRARADREKLFQIFLNLLSNAMKFTPPDGRIRVDTATRVEWDAPADSVFIRVSDTGIGVPRDKQDAIFDPFVQVQHSLTRSTGGTGLGLSISRDLARAMGGDLHVWSVPPEGSTFTLTLAPSTTQSSDQPH